MRAVGVVFGILVGAILGIVFSKINLSLFIDFVEKEIYQIVALIVALLILVTAAYIFQNQIIKIIFGVSTSTTQQMVERFISLFVNVAKGDLERTKKDGKEAVLSAVALYSNWSFRIWAFQTLIAVVVILAGSFGTIVLIQQNDLIKRQEGLIIAQTDRVGEQNDLIENQNSLLKVQNQSVFLQAALQESNRRAVLAPTVAQLIADIDKLADSSAEAVEVPEALSLRIQGILPILQPYVILDFKSDILDFNLPVNEAANVLRLSPERGQILQALLRSRVNFDEPEYLDVHRLDFSYADMRDFEFFTEGFDPNCSIGPAQNFYSLDNLDLSHADFSGAVLSGVSLSINSESRWYGAKIDNSSVLLLHGATKWPQFLNTTFSNTFFSIASAAEASLSGVIFESDINGCLFFEEGVEEIGETKPNSLYGLKVDLYNDPKVKTDTDLKKFFFEKYADDQQGIVQGKYKLSIQKIVETYGEYYEISFR